MMTSNAEFHEIVKVVTGFGPALPSTAVPDYVSLKNHAKCAIIIQGLNATTVTGSAITLLQATAVAGTGAKALAFDRMYANIDTAATDTLVETAVVANTFTTTAVNSKASLYVITVDATDLDAANGFDCIRAGTADAVATSLSVTYCLYGAKYGQTQSAIID